MASSLTSMLQNPSLHVFPDNSAHERPISRQTSASMTPTSATTSTRKSLKARLAAGERLYGAFLCSFSPVMAEILGWAGYDYVVVDMEHGPGDAWETLPCLRALASTGTHAVVRIAENSAVLAKKALDLGVDGIMIPMIDTASDAAMAVASCRYPPRGIRGAAHPIARASRYGINTNYLESCDDTLLILQIESEKAVERIPEIAAVDGVDCLMLGPTDLSSSIGLLHDTQNPAAMNLVRKAEEAVLSINGMYLAGFAMPHDPPEELFKRGCHMVSGAVDVALFRNAVLTDIKANKPVT